MKNNKTMISAKKNMPYVSRSYRSSKKMAEKKYRFFQIYKILRIQKDINSAKKKMKFSGLEKCA